MSDIFISYARDDKERVEPLAIALSKWGWTIFWDQQIPPARSWAEVLGAEMAGAKVAIVCWSKNSFNRPMIFEEATQAFKMNKYVPILLDNDHDLIPSEFSTIHTLNLASWKGSGYSAFLDLTNHLEETIGVAHPMLSLEGPGIGMPVTEDHLALIHTSWRAKDKDFKSDDGRKYYQIRVIVFGDASALDRIEKVVYYLHDAYKPKNVYTCTDRKRNFELKELANGYSVIRAEVIIKDQVRHVRLARFMNLTETGPRLDHEFFKSPEVG